MPALGDLFAPAYLKSDRNVGAGTAGLDRQEPLR